jgi:hypothetical protein
VVQWKPFHGRAPNVTRWQTFSGTFHVYPEVSPQFISLFSEGHTFRLFPNLLYKRCPYLPVSINPMRYVLSSRVESLGGLLIPNLILQSSIH